MDATKVGIVVRNDLQAWQKLNVAAFLATGIAASSPESIGQPYKDASEVHYLALISQPIIVYDASLEELKRTNARALSRGVGVAIYTDGMFKTFNDEDNREVVKVLSTTDLDLVGIAIRADRRTFDKITHGLSLHS